MKILIFTSEFPPFAGGAGTYSADLAIGLASLGVEVHIATPFYGSIAEQPFEFDVDRLHFHYILECSEHKKKQTILFLWGLHLFHSFDCVIVTERRAQEIIAELRYSFFPYIATIHGTEIIDYFKNSTPSLPIPRKLMSRFYTNAIFCIAVSESTRKLTLEHIKNKINLVTIFNGINIDRLPAPLEKNIIHLKENYGFETQIILCIGRLDTDKGHRILLHAFKEVISQKPKVKLLIVGEGPLKNELIFLRSELGLQSAVEFLGKIPQKYLANYFCLSDIFVMPSKCENRWEGFGLVYLEANYYEKPVIGGNEGGVPEAIENGRNGFIVDPRNHFEVANAILKLLDDSKLRTSMGSYGKRRVLEYFNSKRMAKDTLELMSYFINQSRYTSGTRTSSYSVKNILYGLILFFDFVIDTLKKATIDFLNLI